MKTTQLLTLVAVAAMLLAGCSGTTDTTQTAPSSGSPTSHSSDGTDHPTPQPVPPTPQPQPDASKYPVPSADVTLTGSGSSFVKPLVDAWAVDYNKEHGNIHVGYNGGGSGKGRGDIRDKLVQYAGTDAPMTAAEQAAAPDILTIPDTIGPVNAVYNVNGVGNGLHLTGDLLGQIFAGCVKMWDDPAIVALNAGVTLPHATIGIIYRSDSSGTTFAFTDYLAKVSPCWSSKVASAASSKPDWSRSAAMQPGGQPQNDGVAAAVKGTANTIGYVDLAWAQKLSLNSATVQNQAGDWVAPSVEGAAKAALAYVDALPQPNADWSKVSIVNAPGAGAYPISSFSYILVYGKLADYGAKCTPDQYAALKAWIYWDLHQGQIDYPDVLGYAPLPSQVVAIGDHAVEMMTA